MDNQRKADVQNNEDNKVVSSSELFYAFSSRGMGSEFGKCFKCDNFGLQSNISGFVETKEAGEKIVEMFNSSGVYLDWREYEPNWIQVKILACKEHFSQLALLNNMIMHKDGISLEIVKFIN